MATPQPIVLNQVTDSSGTFSQDLSVGLPQAMDEPEITHRLSEADRLAEVFQEIDTWANSDGGMTAMVNNHAIDGTYVGRDVSREFNSVIFDGDDDNLPSRMDSVIAMTSDFTKASDLYHRYKFLVGYLQAGKGTNPIGTFIQEIRQDTEANPHWHISSDMEFKYAWYTLWVLLNFPANITIKADTFQGQINRLFPPQSRRIMTSTSFSISLIDLEIVDLRVKPTVDLDQHLLIEGNTVNILQVDRDALDLLRKFKNNRAAQALGISSLGEEILSSLHALYVRDEFVDKAEALGVFASQSELDRTMVLLYLRSVHVNVKPKVLAHRAHTLQKLVKYRLSWWPSLVRDMKKQLQTQPLFFYGAVLALFFGVCTVIQTVASVYSVVLALQAMR